MEQAVTSSIPFVLTHFVVMSLDGIIKEFGIDPSRTVHPLGDLDRNALRPILDMEQQLPLARETYIIGQPPRRVRIVPASIINKSDALRYLIKQSRKMLASDSRVHESTLFALDRFLLEGCKTSARLQFYSPSEPPLVPHVDSGDVAIVVVLRLKGLQGLDESLRWFDCSAMSWRSHPVSIGSVVAIPGGVLHAVRRPVAAERVTLIMMLNNIKVTLFAISHE